MAPEQMPQEAAQAAPEGAAPAATGDKDPMQMISDLGSKLQSLGQALQQSGAPDQVLQPLSECVAKFGEFMEALQGKGKQPMANSDAQQGGNPNAVPAQY